MVKLPLKLIYPEEIVTEPIVSKLAKEIDVLINIRQAGVTDSEGWLVCELDGSSENVDMALKWLENHGVEIAILGSEV